MVEYLNKLEDLGLKPELLSDRLALTEKKSLHSVGLKFEYNDRGLILYKDIAKLDLNTNCSSLSIYLLCYFRDYIRCLSEAGLGGIPLDIVIKRNTIEVKLYFTNCRLILHCDYEVVYAVTVMYKGDRVTYSLEAFLHSTLATKLTN